MEFYKFDKGTQELENFSLREKVVSLASNVYVKAFVSETTDKAHPDSWENSRPPGALLKITAWGQVKASGPLCSRKRHKIT